jgi:gamma-glutamyltranspeptidase/glutathione hydrolase
MINFHPLPGRPNSIAPGKARTTGMSPTIVYRDGAPVLVIGAPGATRIVTALVQVIVNVVDFGMTLQEAILAPRIDAQGAGSGARPGSRLTCVGRSNEVTRSSGYPAASADLPSSTPSASAHPQDGCPVVRTAGLRNGPRGGGSVVP